MGLRNGAMAYAPSVTIHNGLPSIPNHIFAHRINSTANSNLVRNGGRSTGATPGRFFFRTYSRGISHVGIYIGGNRFIHAPRTGRTVAVEPLTGYYRRRFVTARRLAGAAPPS